MVMTSVRHAEWKQNILSDMGNMNNTINGKLLQVACQRQIANC